MTQKLIMPDVPKKAPPKPPQRCGNCFWHISAGSVQPGLVTCQSIPPTPICLGVAPDALGRPVPQIINVWPQMPGDQKACRLWDPENAQMAGERAQ